MGALNLCCECDQTLSVGEESGIPGVIIGSQFVGDIHHRSFAFSKLNLKNERGVEATTGKKVVVPKRDVVNGVVLPGCLRAVWAVDWNICAGGVVRGFLSRTVLERRAELTI